MRYLLDTNVLLWLFSGEKEDRFEDVSSLINNEKNEIFYSIASVWEIAIKHIKKPLLMPLSPENFVKMCNKIGFVQKNINNDHIYTLKNLKLSNDAPRDHQDPFDRIIMAQAKFEKMTLITGDHFLKWYKEENIMFV